MISWLSSSASWKNSKAADVAKKASAWWLANRKRFTPGVVNPVPTKTGKVYIQARHVEGHTVGSKPIERNQRTGLHEGLYQYRGPQAPAPSWAVKAYQQAERKGLTTYSAIPARLRKPEAMATLATLRPDENRKPRGPSERVMKAIARAADLMKNDLPAGVSIVRLGHAELAKTLTPKDLATTILAYRSAARRIEINEKHHFWKNQKRTMKLLGGGKHFGTDNPDHLLFHDVGHAWHHHNIGDDATFNAGRGFQAWRSGQRPIALRVSPYAGRSPNEFVAEVYAGLKDGRGYDDEVMSLFELLKGVRP